MKLWFKLLLFGLTICTAAMIGCYNLEIHHERVAGKHAPYSVRSRDKIVQVSTLQALIQGAYDQAASYDELAPYGDFGIGTFNGLDGEMVMVDNKLFQVAADGVARRMSRKEGTPFAMVTYFDVDQTIRIDAPIDFKALCEKIDDQLPSKNIFYAIKVKGEFKRIKVRSVPKQKKPYPLLTRIVKTQPVFDLENVQGELVGFRLPTFMAKSNMPGYHLHFLTADRKAGGHLLACDISSGTVYVDASREIQIMLPKNNKYSEKHAKKITDEDVHQVESLYD